jgi:hypothetical protein
VRPLIAVRRARRKRGYDSDGERKPPSRRWLARQRRRQAKAAAAAIKLSEDDVDTAAEAEAEVDAEDVDVDDDDDDDEGNESGDETVDVGATPASAPGDPEEPPHVLVVQKIETSNIDGQLMAVFSAVGCVYHLEWFCLPANLTPPSATALFWFALPPDPPAAVSGTIVVHNYDFECPVVTFTPVAGSSDCVWVSLDPHWSGESPSPDVLLHVRLIRLGPDSVRRTFAYTATFSSLSLRRAKFPLHPCCYQR